MSAEIAEKTATTRVEETLGKGALEDARIASEQEHAATFAKTFSKYRGAVFWSAVVSMSIIMEGYDTILIGNFWAYPSFQRKFGEYQGEEDGWQVSAPWQAGLKNASTIGTIFGAILNGWATSRWGYRKVLTASMVAMNAFIFIVFFAPNAIVLTVGQILCGLPWGVFATSAPAYASEVVPLGLRPYLTVYVNLCWAIGQFIAAGVLQGLVDRTDQWGYRIPFAIQWVWPVPLMFIYWFMPESPWWLVQHDKFEEAASSLNRLGKISEQETKGSVAMILHTTQIERETTKGTSYLDCFKGSNLRRTEIASFAFAGQIMSGSSFAYSPTYFFTNAGIDTEMSYALGLAGTAFAFVGTILSWFLIGRIGRRTLYLCGQILLCFWLLIIGIVSVATSSQSGLWAQASFSMVWLFTYALTVGPITYAIVSEISSVRLRAQTVVIARSFYQVINIASSVLVPYQLNPQEFNWKGASGFFWAGAAGITAVWAFFRLAEPKDRTYEELDILFNNGVSARKFASTHVDAYEEHDTAGLTHHPEKAGSMTERNETAPGTEPTTTT